MNTKLMYGLLLVALSVSCGGRDSARSQQQYETVEEGSAAGVTSTIHGPGETLPPITGTNADTTSGRTPGNAGAQSGAGATAAARDAPAGAADATAARALTAAGDGAADRHCGAGAAACDRYVDDDPAAADANSTAD
jgi:hypothetical protein